METRRRSASSRLDLVMALIIVKNIYKYLHAEIAASTLDCQMGEGHGRYREAGIRAAHEDEVGKL